MYNVYQEYINNIMGISPNNNNFQENVYNNWIQTSYFQNQNNVSNLNLERFYPELYRLIYPMIQSACMRNTKPITKESLDEMVIDIYSNFVSEEATILNSNFTNDAKTASKEVTVEVNNKNSTRTLANNKVSSKDRKELENSEERSFRPNNYVLNDLIRILLIRELAGRPANNRLTSFPFRANEQNFAMPDYSLYENNFDDGYNIF